jgi:hypothetical protein
LGLAAIEGFFFAIVNLLSAVEWKVEVVVSGKNE